MSSSLYPVFYRKPLLPGTIRLLRLLPDEDEKAHILCELFHYPLQESNTRTHPYEALSYVWGKPAETKQVFIRQPNAQSEDSLLVTDNLHEVLSRLRNRYIDRFLWIDAICINQKDEREKEQQIQSMARIYARANRVLVWLGELADDSDRALQLIRKAGNSKLENIESEDHRAIMALLQRPWFRRIWVLQEVAAARSILIVCGPTEIDGYAFCLGLESFESKKLQGDLLHLARPVIFLMKESIFRPDISMGGSGNSSLEICPLAELIDMYHAHKATKHHDKVYALLGMSSDDYSNVGLLPDYSIPWEELLKRLVRCLLHGKVLVETLGGNLELAVIKNKAVILGKVSFVETGIGKDDRKGIEIQFKDKKRRIRWSFQASAKPMRAGDLVCLLRGATKLTIIRPYYDFFDIIMFAATLPIEDLLRREVRGSTHSLLLVWDWENCLKTLQRQNTYRDLLLLKAGVSDNSTKPENQLDEANRIWTAALIAGDLEDYGEGEEKLKGAIKRYGVIFGVEPYALKSQYGLTPLAWAAGNGYEAVVRYLFREREARIYPDLEDSQYGQTPLSWAAEYGHDAIVKLLLAAGVDINAKDLNERTPLSWAVGNGHSAVTKLLLNTGKVDLHAKDKKQRTPLLWAALNGHKATLELLLATDDVSIDIDVKDQTPWTPLQWAAAHGHSAVVKLLLETGKVNVNTKDQKMRTPLSCAAEFGHDSVVELLLQKGNADFTIRDNDFWSPLHWATEKGHGAVVKLLLERDEAGVDLKDFFLQTPLFLAASQGRDVVVELLLKTEKVDVNTQGLYLKTPLLIAAEKGHNKVVTLLLNTNKVNINMKDRSGWTPLQQAAGNGHDIVVKSLLETGKVHTDIETQYGQALLLWAVEKKHREVVKLLLKTGKASWYSKAQDKKALLEWAMGNRHQPTLKLLHSFDGSSEKLPDLSELGEVD